MRPPWLGGLALLLLTGFYALHARNLAGAAVISLLLLAGMARGGRLRLGPIGHGLLLGVAAALAWVLSLAAPPGEGAPLPPPWSGLASWALLAAGLRLLTAAPPLQEPGTMALGLLALLFCGQGHFGLAYQGTAAGSLLLFLLAMRASDGERPRWRDLPRRAQLLALLLPALVLPIALLLVLPLKPLQKIVQERFEDAFTPRARVGFSAAMALGGRSGMLDSTRPVLRIRAEGQPGKERPDYLRGAVYDRYREGAWIHSNYYGTARAVKTYVGRLSGPGVYAVEHLGNDEDPFFLPLALGEVGTTSGTLKAGPMGVIRDANGRRGWRLWFRLGPRKTAQPAPPGVEDTTVPAPLRGMLQGLVEKWVGAEQDPAARLERLISHLQREYRYSLDVPHRSGTDPVMSFLLGHKRGYCEYFASALALLGRAAGVPTRVVTGYRVTEWNRLGGYYMVRERNAHAWVEAHLPGLGWTVLDATPPGEVNRQQETPLISALLDVLSQDRDRLLRAMEQLGRQVGPGLVGVGLLVLLSFWLRRRRQARRAQESGQTGSPEFLHLLEALGRAGAGIRREGWEPLEDFAARVPDEEAAALILRYAALRYGGAVAAGQEAEEVAAALRACAKRLRG
jgi:hypothetical protein